MVLLATGCGSLNAPNHPADLPLRYHNAQYDFTFFLPADWRGYSVLVQQWEGSISSDTADKATVPEHGPALVFRHPQWNSSAPRQDIPILVFTRSQWDADKQGKFFYGAGGIETEVAHNAKHVFAVHSRFNWGELKGWEEAGKIVERNGAANEPHLYPE